MTNARKFHFNVHKSLKKIKFLFPAIILGSLILYYSHRFLTGTLTNPKKVFQLGRTPILLLRKLHCRLKLIYFVANSKVNEKSFAQSNIELTQPAYYFNCNGIQPQLIE